MPRPNSINPFLAKSLIFFRFHTKKQQDQLDCQPLYTTTNYSSKIKIITTTKWYTPELMVQRWGLWDITVKNNSEILKCHQNFMISRYPLLLDLHLCWIKFQNRIYFKKNGFTITWIEIVIRHRAFSIFNSLRLLILIFPMAFAILLLVCWLMHLSLRGNYFIHRSFFVFCDEKHDWWSPKDFIKN